MLLADETRRTHTRRIAYARLRVSCIASVLVMAENFKKFRDTSTLDVNDYSVLVCTEWLTSKQLCLSLSPKCISEVSRR